MHPIAFFDVDSLELSPNGMTYACHPNVSSISEELFETYSIISTLSAPLIFSVDVNRNTPGENNKRCDFLTLPASTTDNEWKKMVSYWYKFYVQREDCADKKQNEIFTNNKSVFDCVKMINPNEWIVFGNGVEYGVDKVICKLLELNKPIKFVSELIIPGVTEDKDQIESYYQKWVEKGATRITYEDVVEIAHFHKY